MEINYINKWFTEEYSTEMIRRELDLMFCIEKNKEVIRLRNIFPSSSKYEIGKKAEKNILKKNKVSKLLTHYLNQLRIDSSF